MTNRICYMNLIVKTAAFGKANMAETAALAFTLERYADEVWVC